MRGSIVKRGSRWSVVVQISRDEDGRRDRQWYSGFESKEAAEQALTKILSELDGGTYIPPEKLTVKRYVEDEWLPSLDAAVAAARLKPTTANQYRNLARAHVVPQLGTLLLRDVTTPVLNRMYGKLLQSGRKRDGGPLSTTTVRAIHITVHRALRDAVRWGRLARNVSDNCDAPTVRNADMKTWTAEQLRAFLVSIKDHEFFPLYATLTTTGLRRGEAAGLTWGDLDLDAGTLTVKNTRVVMNYAVLDSSPKTEKSARTIGLDLVTIRTLRIHRTKQAWNVRLLGPDRELTPTDLVFTWADGRAIHPEVISRTFQRLATKAKLPVIRLHDLRHSYATAALEAGVPLKVVSEHVGHSSISITGDVYSHVRPEVDKAAAEKTAAYILGSGA